MAKTTISLTFPDGATAQGTLETQYCNWDKDVAWTGPAAERVPDRLRHIAPAYLQVLIPHYLPNAQFEIKHEGLWLPPDTNPFRRPKKQKKSKPTKGQSD